MNEEEAKKIIDNMSEQELNDFIFFALKEVEKENQKLKTKLKKKDEIINNAIIEIENLRQYFSEDLQPDFIRILEILKDKKVIDW